MEMLQFLCNFLSVVEHTFDHQVVEINVCVNCAWNTHFLGNRLRLHVLLFTQKQEAKEKKTIRCPSLVLSSIESLKYLNTPFRHGSFNDFTKLLIFCKTTCGTLKTKPVGQTQELYTRTLHRALHKRTLLKVALWKYREGRTD